MFGEADSFAVLRGIEGTPYLWSGGHGPRPLVAARGYDCSGFVRVAVWALGVGRSWVDEDRSSGLLEAELPKCEAQPGALAFYGRSSVTHVVLIQHDGSVIGSSGGGNATDTVEKALAIGAGVKTQRSHLYRSDFRGCGWPPYGVRRDARDVAWARVWSRYSWAYLRHLARQRGAMESDARVEAFQAGLDEYVEGVAGVP